MANYLILIETKKGQFFQEEFEEKSGFEIKERVDEIKSKGFIHEDLTGIKFSLTPNDIKSIETELE